MQEGRAGGYDRGFSSEEFLTSDVDIKRLFDKIVEIILLGDNSVDCSMEKASETATEEGGGGNRKACKRKK